MGRLQRKIKQIELEIEANRENLTCQKVLFKNYITSPRGIFALMFASFSISYILVHKKQFLRTTYKILTAPFMLKYAYKNLSLMALRYLPGFFIKSDNIFR